MIVKRELKDTRASIRNKIDKIALENGFLLSNSRKEKFVSICIKKGEVDVVPIATKDFRECISTNICVLSSTRDMLSDVKVKYQLSGMNDAILLAFEVLKELENNSDDDIKNIVIETKNKILEKMV